MEEFELVSVHELPEGKFLIVSDRQQTNAFYWIAADQSESDGPFDTAADAERHLPRLSLQ